jgi:hypothetical protein
MIAKTPPRTDLKRPAPVLWWTAWFDVQWKVNKWLQIISMPVVPPDFWRIEEQYLKATQENMARLLHVPYQGISPDSAWKVSQKEAPPLRQKERLLLTKVLE